MGGYRLLGRLGQGGMGAVYLGRGAEGRLVAVKMIRPEFAYDTEFRGRFRSEVNRARQVPPFCTAEVLDADPDHSTPYLVVEYVDGPSLAQVIAGQGPLSGGSLHSVAVGVATALSAIHGAGVIHRDLKPGNVLLARGMPKVIDFGIARAFEATSQHTRTDQMVGTVAYMAPERFDTDGGAVGPAADVFAWGAVVTYAATGRTPFQADSPAATAARILTQPPELSGLPEPLRSVVTRALAKDPAERPTAPQLLNLLLDLDAADTTELLRPELLRTAVAAQRAPGRTGKGSKRRIRAAVVAGVGALVLAGAGLLAAQALPGLGAATDDVIGDAAPASARPSLSRAAGGTEIFDRLDRPGQWKDTRTDADGRCLFTDGRLEARTGMSPVYRCQGPADSFAKDQAVSVDATVLTPGSCAVIWLRATGADAYLVSLCESEVRLGVDAADGVTGEVRAAVTGTGLGRARRVEVVVRDEKATVAVDGTEVLATPLGEASLKAGRVTFGVIDDIISGDARAAFTQAKIMEL
ncbi:WD-40 repeat-containing serine/threonine protein kinase [Actinoplanes friuliensis DSM 7358]|uniref:WD-40 repeat-containing serine/threonine protein kinase n=1 Tax=Actinoplanes friuliensis DSM 7358 TaxID=1246995 RepID=U5VZV6_9ACTN|nr:WD-40 repeat-containing serine/threonine protein kinase [Actinoplanes friuliensis DSM 7358]